jgi:hypothetical protein
VVGSCPGLADVEAPPRSRSSLSSEAEVESEPLGRARWRPSAETRAESEPWGRAKRSSSSSGADLCIKMPLRLKCPCDLVGSRGDLAKVASW